MAPAVQAEWSPSDWPESLQEMRVIDNLLRCSICFEYFDIPVMVQECSHNYCSVCIRRSITFDTQCPTCHMKTVQQDLRCNRVLDELVKNFIAVRQKLLQLINQRYQTTENISSCAKTPSSHPSTGKRKSRTTPSVTPGRKRKRRIIDSDDEDKTFEAITIKQEPECAADSTKKTPKGKQPRKSPTRPPDFAECPVCGELILQSKVNSHLDLCLTRNEKKEALRSSNSPQKKEQKMVTEEGKTKSVKQQSSMFSPSAMLCSPPSTSTQGQTTLAMKGSNSFIPTVQKRKPLPKLVYTLLSDKQLKQKLRECGLPTQGPREKLIKTHREYVTLYNAQCDSANPMSGAMIIKQMEQNEKKKIKLTEASTSDSSTHFKKQTSKEETEAANRLYLKEHQSEFDQLIENIRSRRNKGNRAGKRMAGSDAKTDDDGKPSTEIKFEGSGQMEKDDKACRNNSTNTGETSEEICDVKKGQEPNMESREGAGTLEDVVVIDDSTNDTANDDAPDDNDDTPCSSVDEDNELTPSLGLTGSDMEEDAESEEDAYSLNSSPIVAIATRRKKLFDNS
ncbi:E3 ubiquitin-protein ligase RAD18 isoform X3 [Nematostella vectensis]|uniref:E3 ubiquitin-protein ligase RAD18 isoform X3 n=1 Tax=Nematostella vectensis TaxID=45351 RepID=UPI00207728EC|nr:E3 ubiquitin-protein ligase RAD18 isoform X3 [Nematostella vectensis]